MKIKSPKTIFLNILYLAILSVILLPKIELYFENRKTEGTRLPLRVSFIPENKRSLLIFWSTTCLPCLVEMKRLKKSVERKIIEGSSVIAINSFEGEREVDKFLKKTPFPFSFHQSPELGNALRVKVTPTTLLLDGHTIISQSSGLSITGILNAESFLNGH